jgi:hypothetical protein
MKSRRHLVSFVGGTDPNEKTADPDVVALIDAERQAERQARALAAQLRRTQAELEATRGALRTASRIL